MEINSKYFFHLTAQTAWVLFRLLKITIAFYGYWVLTLGTFDTVLTWDFSRVERTVYGQHKIFPNLKLVPVPVKSGWSRIGGCRILRGHGDGQKPFALESGLSLLKLRVKNFSTKGWGGGSVDKGHAEYSWGQEFRSLEPTFKKKAAPHGSMYLSPQSWKKEVGRSLRAPWPASAAKIFN